MARVKCQACGGRTEEAAFCEKCGAPLAEGERAATRSPAAEERKAERPPSPERFVDEAPEDRAPRAGVRVAVAGEAEPLPLARNEGAAACAELPSREFDDCPWLSVERDTVAFCVADAPGVLRLRFTAAADGLQNLQAGLVLFGVSVAIQPVHWFKPRRGRSEEFNLTIPSLSQGGYGAELSVRFLRDGVVQKYTANLSLQVYPSGISAKQIAEKIVININNDIKMGHASDLHQSLDAASALGNLAGNDHAHRLGEVLNLSRTDLRAYHRIRLREDEVLGGLAALAAPPAEACLDRLTLAAGNRLLHLVAGAPVTLGRNRGCRIVARRFDRNGVAASQLNERISKIHCTLELSGTECAVLDGGVDDNGQWRRSTWGVFWQGRNVNGGVRFPVEGFPASATLGLAGTAEAPDFRMTAHGSRFDPSRCADCPTHRQHACRKGKVPSVLLNRGDSVPESYALIWSCLDLGGVFPGCAGIAVCHEQGAFSWRSGTGSGWLVPGESFAAGVGVRPFAQYGL